MALNSPKTQPRGLLPTVIVTPTDIITVRHELEAIDEFLDQAAIRKSGQALSLPKVGYLLNELVTVNNLNLLNPSDRVELVTFLKNIHETAPLIHISFAADPSAAFMSKIVAWFRENVHPQVLVQVGLQPNIAAGCTVRTANKVFDLSLRKGFSNNRRTLVKLLNEVSAK